jgi:hypothetical protein
MTQYRIHWTDKRNGRTGKGTNLFDKEKAEALAKELNEQFEHIEHIAKPAAENYIPKARQAAQPTPRPFTPLSDSDPCPIEGMHKGRPMGSVPAPYLDWLYGQEWMPRLHPAVYDYIKRTLKAINQDLERAER